MTRDKLGQKDNQMNDNFKDSYLAEKQYRQEHPEIYPYFGYFMYGWHNMDNFTEEEAEELAKFYHMWKTKDGWERAGRQPIIIRRRWE